MSKSSNGSFTAHSAPEYHENIHVVELTEKDKMRLDTGWPMFNKFICFRGKGLKINLSTFIYAGQGVGKTTFLMTLANAMSSKGMKILYNSTEQTAKDLKGQISSYGFTNPIGFSNYSDVNSLLAFCEEKFVRDITNRGKQLVLMVDSLISLTGDGDMVETMTLLNAWTKAHDAILFVIGTVNQDGKFKGPNTIGHIVDTELTLRKTMGKTFEKGQLVLVANKNRQGKAHIEFAYDISTDEGFVFKNIVGEKVEEMPEVNINQLIVEDTVQNQELNTILGWINEL